jgi:hypothetical protein
MIFIVESFDHVLPDGDVHQRLAHGQLHRDLALRMLIL